MVVIVFVSVVRVAALRILGTSARKRSYRVGRRVLVVTVVVGWSVSLNCRIGMGQHL